MARGHIGRDGFVLPPGIPFPDLSTNREKYSEPEDVVLGYEEDAVAIAAARVRDIPERVGEYEFRPVHVPEPENYAHTEVRTFQEGEHLERKPSKTVRKEFRLSFRLKVLREL